MLERPLWVPQPTLRDCVRTPEGLANLKAELDQQALDAALGKYRDAIRAANIQPIRPLLPTQVSS